MAEGIELSSVLKDIATDFVEADIIFAHNANFDSSVLRSELFRKKHSLLSSIDWCKFQCTMVLTKPLVQATDKNGRLKNPKLSELYKFATGVTMENAHDSLHDTRNLHSSIVEIASKSRKN